VIEAAILTEPSPRLLRGLKPVRETLRPQRLRLAQPNKYTPAAYAGPAPANTGSCQPPPSSLRRCAPPLPGSPGVTAPADARPRSLELLGHVPVGKDQVAQPNRTWPRSGPQRQYQTSTFGDSFSFWCSQYLAVSGSCSALGVRWGSATCVAARGILGVAQLRHDLVVAEDAGLDLGQHDRRFEDQGAVPLLTDK